VYIISNKKDYYDGVVGTIGVDKTIVYDRKTRELTQNENSKEFPKEFSRDRFDNKCSLISLGHFYTNRLHYDAYGAFIVGFCGKLYVGWKFYSEVKKFDDTSMFTEITYNYEFAKENINHKQYGSNLDDVMKYVLTYDAMSIFRKYNTPVFVMDLDYNRTDIGKYGHGSDGKAVFLINPILKDYEFYKVFNTFAAFQEIQMFMGGVLGRGEKEIIEVEDKYKIAQHGFDKYSFRKDKETK